MCKFFVSECLLLGLVCCPAKPNQRVQPGVGNHYCPYTATVKQTQIKYVPSHSKYETHVVKKTLKLSGILSVQFEKTTDIEMIPVLDQRPPSLSFFIPLLY